MKDKLSTVVQNVLNQQAMSSETQIAFLTSLVTGVLPNLIGHEPTVNHVAKVAHDAYKVMGIVPDTTLHTLFHSDGSCPICHSDDGQDGSSWELAAGVASQSVSCGKCLAEWVDEYSNHSYSNIRLGEFIPITLTSYWEEGVIDTDGILNTGSLEIDCKSVDTPYEHHLSDKMSFLLCGKKIHFTLSDQLIPEQIRLGLESLFADSLLLEIIQKKLATFLSIEGVQSIDG